MSSDHDITPHKRAIDIINVFKTEIQLIVHEYPRNAAMPDTMGILRCSSRGLVGPFHVSDEVEFLSKDTITNVALIRFDVTQFVNLGQVPSEAPFLNKLPSADLALVRPFAACRSLLLLVCGVVVSADR